MTKHDSLFGIVPVPDKQPWWKDRYGIKPWVVVTAVISMILVLTIALTSLALWSVVQQCHRWEALNGEDTRYELTGGCMVYTDSGWVQLEQIRSNRG